MSRSSFKTASKDELCLILKHVGIEDAERCCKGDVRNFITKNFNLYKPHNNGGRPFEVFVSKDMIVAFPLKFDEEYENSWYDYNDPVFTLGGYDKIWLGDDFKTPLNDFLYFELGNSLLIKKGKDYYFFSHNVIKKFRTLNDEKIIRFGSPIVGTDVPWPFAVGETHTYFLLEEMASPNVKGIDLPTVDDKGHNYTKNQVPWNMELIYEIDN
jgi:hypothetical protein